MTTSTTDHAPSITETRIKYYEKCMTQKPWIVVGNYRSHPASRPVFLQAERKRRVVTTTLLHLARGFNTEQEAQAWVDNNGSQFGGMVFGTRNRHDIAKSMISYLQKDEVK